MGANGWWAWAAARIIRMRSMSDAMRTTIQSSSSAQHPTGGRRTGPMCGDPSKFLDRYAP